VPRGWEFKGLTENQENKEEEVRIRRSGIAERAGFVPRGWEFKGLPENQENKEEEVCFRRSGIDRASPPPRGRGESLFFLAFLVFLSSMNSAPRVFHPRGCRINS
jgi:hypothetical protein